MNDVLPCRLQDVANVVASRLSLGAALDSLRSLGFVYRLVGHWKQGEFHHDVVVQFPIEKRMFACVVATNCNAGVKEVLVFGEVPERYALWHWRCPDNPDFSGNVPELLARTETIHNFDPCELLVDSARSELKEEYRERDRGGGWVQKCGAKVCVNEPDDS